MENSNNTKQRHGCVTAWLTLMIIANSFTALLYLFSGEKVAENFPGEVSTTLLMVLGLFGIGNVIFSILLLKWNKIGFWGFIITCIGALIINLNIGLGVGKSLIGLAGLAILYGVLQIKKENTSTWENLD